MLKSIYFGMFQSLLRHGIIIGVGGGDGESIKVFKIQKRVLRMNGGLRKGDMWANFLRLWHPHGYFVVYTRDIMLYKKSIKQI
jgi:hypothetical protein